LSFDLKAKLGTIFNKSNLVAFINYCILESRGKLHHKDYVAYAAVEKY